MPTPQVNNFIPKVRYVAPDHMPKTMLAINPNISGPYYPKDYYAGKKNNPKTATFAGLAAGLLAGISTGIKKSRENAALSKIDKKFDALQGKLPMVKDVFKTVFMRDDLTEQEVSDMLDRYRDIEKLAITGTKEEYAQKLFNEAQKNYGFEGCPLELKLADKPAGDARVLGFTTPIGDVYINKNISPKQMMETIHHELRHFQQRYYAYNLDPDGFVKVSQPKNMELPKEMFEVVYGGKADSSKISGHMEYAQKAKDGIITYRSYKNGVGDYRSQWVESDAYWAGGIMGKLLG